jgi:site-specific DNA-methyltransferase (adenine-specific)
MNKRINSHNPDVLSCIAHLSNDEVFTTSTMANFILDKLPQTIWTDPTVTFLDPSCKSGIFLREIAIRLIKGLKKKIPNQKKRVNHILKNQLYGFSITELTAFLSRRTLYYSKSSSSKYSACNNFNNDEGNIFYKNFTHSWKGDKCIYCNAAKNVYERNKINENHAYSFIHNNIYKEFFKKNMKFDVIVGNPPYQLTDGGHGTSASPIYQLFVEQAKKLNPRYISMIIPARWYSGGKGLDQFRDTMLKDKRITHLVDFFDSTECFPGVDISGGVCYFLWDRDNEDECLVESHLNKKITTIKRNLLEKDSDTFVRFNEAISIIKKVKQFNENSFQTIVSERRPFNLDTNLKLSNEKKEGYVKCYAYPKQGYVNKSKINKNLQAVNKYKVFIAKAYGERGNFPYLVTGKPFLGVKNTCSTETYLMVGPFEDQDLSNNVISYMNTKFFRFMVLLKKNTQNAARGVYSFVPTQDFRASFNDKKLYKKYNLSDKEINFIENMVRPSER